MNFPHFPLPICFSRGGMAYKNLEKKLTARSMAMRVELPLIYISATYNWIQHMVRVGVPVSSWIYWICFYFKTFPGPLGETTVTRWVDTDAEWWLTPLVETRIRIEADGVHGSKREVHEITVTHDSGTSVSVETKPVHRDWYYSNREWYNRLPASTTTTYNTLSRALEWRKWRGDEEDLFLTLAHSLIIHNKDHLLFSQLIYGLVAEDENASETPLVYLILLPVLPPAEILYLFRE